ncbi:DUF302 domain-containing protein [Candidatus Nitrospira bockiana]
MIGRRTGLRTAAKAALAVAILAGSVSSGLPGWAAGQADTVVHVKVKGSVEDTVGRLKKVVAGNDMMVMGELHQGKVLSMTGLNVQSESLFVGSPTVGKKLFTVEPGAGVVVPVRINIYQDAQGTTVVSYAKPSALLSTFGNPEVTNVGQMLDGKLQNMVKMLGQ